MIAGAGNDMEALPRRAESCVAREPEVNKRETAFAAWKIYAAEGGPTPCWYGGVSPL